MNNIYAFFDVDETIIRLKSMIDFQKYFFLNHATLGESAYLQYLAQFEKWTKKYDRVVVNRYYYETFKGRRKSEVELFAVEWFRDLKERNKNIYIGSALKALKTHRQNGNQVVLLSGSSIEILSPLADDLEVKYVLATKLEISNGVFTGRIVPPQTIGKGKAVALQGFLREMGCNPADCYAYGDHISDLDMLESVGKPHVIKGDRVLEKIAQTRNWEILNK